MAEPGLAWGEVMALAALGVTLMGMLLVHGRWVLSRIQTAEAEAQARVSEVHARIDGVHARINEVKEGYVRRDDLDQHIQRLERSMDRNSEALERVHNRMDQLIALARHSGDARAAP